MFHPPTAIAKHSRPMNPGQLNSRRRIKRDGASGTDFGDAFFVTFSGTNMERNSAMTTVAPSASPASEWVRMVAAPKPQKKAGPRVNRPKAVQARPSRQRFMKLKARRFGSAPQKNIVMKYGSNKRIATRASERITLRRNTRLRA